MNKISTNSVDSLVSIIMPAYNARKYIWQTVESVIAQTYSNWELIIVDDCSIDETAEFVRREFDEHKTKIHVLEQAENKGAAEARNRAIEHASGTFISFLDCDDLWKPKKLETQIGYMLKHNAAFTFTEYDQIDEDGERVGVVKIHRPKGVSYRNLLKANVILTSTAIYNCKQLGKVYMPLTRRRQDYGLWLKLLNSTPEALLIKDNLTSYRFRSDSLSSNILKSILYTWKIYKNVEKLPTYQCLYYFSHYLLRTSYKRIAARFQ
jgi:glycosyltransferase involved in cell wall biosynthesis